MKRMIAVYVFFLFIGGGLIFAQQDTDEWRKANSVEELLGKWEGKVPFEVDPPLPLKIKISLVLSRETKTSFAFDMTMDFESVFEAIADYSRKLNFDYTKDQLWEAFLEPMNDSEGIGEKMFIEKYYIRVVEKGSEDEVLEGGYINQHGNKWLLGLHQKLVFFLPRK